MKITAIGGASREFCFPQSMLVSTAKELAAKQLGFIPPCHVASELAVVLNEGGRYLTDSKTFAEEGIKSTDTLWLGVRGPNERESFVQNEIENPTMELNVLTMVKQTINLAARMNFLSDNTTERIIREIDHQIQRRLEHVNRKID